MSGHIRRRGERSWELKFDIGCDPLTRRRKTRYHSFKGTKREAQAELTRLLAQAGEGTSVDPAKSTVAELLDIWATGNTSAKTCERCRGLMNNQVKPHIGALPIQKLRPVHLAELYATLLEKGGAVDEDDGRPKLRTRCSRNRERGKTLRPTFGWQSGGNWVRAFAFVLSKWLKSLIGSGRVV